MKNIILISMFFNFAFGQYDRCNTGVTGSIEGCDFSNGKNLEALQNFLDNTNPYGNINDNNARNANFSGINFIEDLNGVNDFDLIDFSGSDFSGSVLAPILGNNNFSDANFSGAMHFGPDSIVIVLPIGIGVALLLISGTKALKKFDRYMDR